MKKILSIVIAAAMLLAISVPAFAATATIDQSTSGGVGNSSVVTDRSGISGTFTVYYPAETTIYWGTESTEIGYTVSSTLVSGNNLRVTVAQDNANLHTGGGRLLPYTIAGDTNITTGHETVANSAYSVNVNITKENWGSVSIDEYEDTLTFTASVEAIA